MKQSMTYIVSTILAAVQNIETMRTAITGSTPTRRTLDTQASVCADTIKLLNDVAESAKEVGKQLSVQAHADADMMELLRTSRATLSDRLYVAAHDKFTIARDGIDLIDSIKKAFTTGVFEPSPAVAQATTDVAGATPAELLAALITVTKLSERILNAEHVDVVDLRKHVPASHMQPDEANCRCTVTKVPETPADETEQFVGIPAPTALTLRKKLDACEIYRHSGADRNAPAGDYAYVPADLYRDLMKALNND